MRHCPNCSAALSEGSRYCSACGAATSVPSELPTAFGPTPVSGLPGAGRIVSSPSATAFAPGQVLADRYRIVGLLGRGGMGEVYRADDLKLGAAVALKFLPRPAERDPAMLERFHAEVRNARQVAHPHVCRVYDIGDVAGRHFLSMEYVDGEDLSSLLRRIGRLPPAKAVEIAQQLAAGLAAAHEKGVLHRDLKPANVMIDGNGRARITDFGLAVLSSEAAAELAGTPAYMSPEQLAGLPATVQSDLYALGLVLYELFTGKRTFDAEGVAEWRRVHSESAPTSPSLITSDMDPAVERVILRCLEKDPGLRPRSAAQVALALPGGDPLAAALAAGETPSPQMVAAAGGEGGFTPLRAWAALGAFAALLAVVFVLAPASTDLGLAPMDKSPDTLRDRAREIAASFGYADPPSDESSWLERDYSPIRWLADHVTSTEWRRKLRELGSPVLLFYRKSPHPLITTGSWSIVTEDDPPLDRPGEVLVKVDATGRLRGFRATPARWSDASGRGESGPIPVEEVFRQTGVDPARFEEAEPEWVPPVPFDARREWTGTRAVFPEMPLRLTVASFEGRVVSVELLGPWDARDSVDPVEASLSATINSAVLAGFLLFVLATAVFFAWRNLRLARGDRRGARRVAAVCFALGMLEWLATAHPVRVWDRLLLEQFLPAVGNAGLVGGVAWLAYVALEPFVRRRMPGLLVGWARVLEGRFRDPRVGRDVLIGLVLAGAISAVFHLVNGLPTWVPFEDQTTIPSMRDVGSGRIIPLGAPVQAAIDAVVRTLAILTLLFAARLFLSRTWLVAGAIWLIAVGLSLGAENPVLELPGAVIMGALFAYGVVRVGPLAVGAMWFTFFHLTNAPLRAGLSTWYAPYALAAWALVIGLAVWSFRASLGGRPAFGTFHVDA